MDSLNSEARQDVKPPVLFVRGSFQPASDAVSRSILELTLALQGQGQPVRIVSWTSPTHMPMLDQLRPGSLVCLSTRSDRSVYTSGDRAKFIVRVAHLLYSQVTVGASIITLEDPTALGISVLPVRLLRRKFEHFVYLMDLQSVQYLRLGHGGGASSLGNRLRGWLDKFTWRHADLVVVLGECMRSMVLELEPKAKVHILPIWQDASRIYAVDAHNAKATLELDEKLVVLYHGHATYRQPMNAVLAAAESLAADDRYRFIVAGGGPSIEWLQAEVRKRDLQNIVVYDRVPGVDMLSVLSMADIHLAILDERATGTCVPSKTYTAMAVGRPCIYIGAADGQAAVDLEAAGAGYVVPGVDPAHLIRSLKKLIGDEPERKKMGQRGYNFFRSERDLDQASLRWSLILAGR